MTRPSTGSDAAPAVRHIDWAGVEAELDELGYACIPDVLTGRLCDTVRGYYDDERVEFRTTVDMARFRFGRGQYKYFDYPLPAPVEALRSGLYPGLATIANRWRVRLGDAPDWPTALAGLTAACHAEGQCRPTPLLLRYGAGDYNHLHQDVYGALLFPLQVILLLSDPRRDFDGGELVLTEQRPRMQSRAIVVPFERGDAVVVPVSSRPEPGRQGLRRVQVRHGVSRVRKGCRVTLGLMFHDAA